MDDQRKDSPRSTGLVCPAGRKPVAIIRIACRRSSCSFAPPVGISGVRRTRGCRGNDAKHQHHIREPNVNSY
jgi:hypothetical protein